MLYDFLCKHEAHIGLFLIMANPVLVILFGIGVFVEIAREL